MWAWSSVQPERGVWQSGGLFQCCSVCHTTGWFQLLESSSIHPLTPSLYFSFPIRTTCCGISWGPRLLTVADPRRRLLPTGELWNCSLVLYEVATIWESAAWTLEHTGERCCFFYLDYFAWLFTKLIIVTFFNLTFCTWRLPSVMTFLSVSGAN